MTRLAYGHRADDRVYLRGPSLLRVPESALGWFRRVGDRAAMVAAHRWVEARRARPGGRCRCGARLPGPISATRLEGALEVDGERLPFHLDTPAAVCRSCGELSFRRAEEVIELFGDVGVDADPARGSVHVGSEREHAPRVAQVWRLTVEEAERLPQPHLGRPTAGRRRFHRPTTGHIECPECAHGDGACLVCGGSGRDAGERCRDCNGSGKCIVCNGRGEVPE